jgi:hypothetical protein
LGEIAINTYDGKVYFKKDNGTASIVELTALASGSVPPTASYAISASYALTASYAVTSTSASYALSASYSFNATSASYALTASSADNFIVRGTLTAQTIVAQTITSSTEFITGSTKFGTQLTDTHQFTGSVSITGSLAVNGSNVILTNQTSSMSVATASYALTASFVPGLNLSQISTGSIVASVDVDPSNLFLIKSGSTQYFNISSSGNTTISSDLFIIKNFTTQQPVVTVSQSIVQFATQSTSPTGIAPNGGFWFTSTDFYVGLN